MVAQQKELLGYWIDTSGQAMCALANTPFFISDRKQAEQINLWGTGLQAVGTAVIADSVEGRSIEKVGTHIESIGYILAIMSDILRLDEHQQEAFEKKGDILQTLGVTVSTSEEIKNGFTLAIFFDLFGYYLQVLPIEKLDSTFKTMIAEWSQLAGSVLSLIALYKDLEQDENIYL